MEMKKPRFGVVVFPGSNCDHDAYHAVKSVMGCDAEFVWHRETSLDGFDCVVLPGGFSYGDYLRSGAVARFSPIMSAVERHATAGGLLIGICNGFQILLEAGLLPGALLRNSSVKFVCREVGVRVDNNRTPFSCACDLGEVLRVPVAHNEGSYFIDPGGLESLRAKDQVVFRYSALDDLTPGEANPNGALDDIAGICNEAGNVLGMMPHPERVCEPEFAGGQGRRVFESIVAWLARNGNGRGGITRSGQD
jgi:phosphoribosylformylglycinamidine synthase